MGMDLYLLICMSLLYMRVAVPKFYGSFLFPEYFTKFSIDARRQPCIRGGQGASWSVAKAANCRKIMVEERCLRQLLDHVRCREKGCGEKLDERTIKLAVRLFYYFLSNVWVTWTYVFI